jgi:undecaprenyl-diphosphatase
MPLHRTSALAGQLSIALSVLMTLLFAFLAYAVTTEAAMPLDLAIRGAVHTLASPPLTLAMRAVTQLGSAPFLVSFALLLIWRFAMTGRNAAIAPLIVAMIGGETLETVLKLAFHRVRPEAFFGIAEPVTYSFPSGHAIMSLVFYGTAAVLLTAGATAARKTAAGALTALFVAAIGFSRIYLGVHYPSDVAAGYAAGLGWLAAVTAWARMR